MHYFEVTFKSTIKGGFKIGVTKSLDFDRDSSFCDHATGFGYYSLGQLRTGSNKQGNSLIMRGIRYGDYLQPGKHTVGVLINLNQGRVVFYINGSIAGDAYSGLEFKEGPLYPAVAIREGVRAELLSTVYNVNDILSQL